MNYGLTVLGLSTYSADSRAVTKRGLFDCKPVSLITAFINENKCITAVRVPTKVIDENLWNPRRFKFKSLNKTAQAVVLPFIKENLRSLRELHTKFLGFNR